MHMHDDVGHLGAERALSALLEPDFFGQQLIEASHDVQPENEVLAESGLDEPRRSTRDRRSPHK